MKQNSSHDVNSDGGSDPHGRRPLPHNTTAEQVLLGSIFMDDAAYDVVSDLLTPEHFFQPVHGAIYAHIEEMLRAGLKATPVTLKPYFENVTVRSGVSGAEYLGQLAVAGAPLHAVKSYAQTIYDLALRRALISTGRELVDISYDMPIETTPIGLIEKAEEDLYTISNAKTDAVTVTFENSLSAVVKQAIEAQKTGGRDSGLSTGLMDLDSKLGGGLQPGQLIVIAARPSMGKTALAMNIAYRAATRLRKAKGQDVEGDDGRQDWTARRGAPVGFYSLEMSDEELTRRILADESGVKANQILAGSFSEVERATIIEKEELIRATPLYIDPTGGISIAKLGMRLRRLKRQQGIGLALVDYLQLMTGTRRRGENRVQEIGEISGGLKSLAKELEIPIIALSQLSRGVESREDKRPNLSDLRDSGTIEQDADVVIFLYREEYYWLKANPEPSGPYGRADWEQKWREEGQKNIAELIIAKQRNGQTGTVRSHFNPDFTRFTDLRREG